MRSMSIARRRKAGGAMALGAILGLALLGWMRPGEIEAREPVAAVAKRPVEKKELRVHRAASTVHRAPVAASAAAPAPAPEVVLPAVEGRGWVVVDVVDEDGRPADDARVVAVDCPGFTSGPPGEYQVDAGPCTLRAMRRDGALLARGTETTVEVGGPDPAYVQLELSGKR